MQVRENSLIPGKLADMLNSLQKHKDLLARADSEPVSSQLETIKKQININNGILEDLAKKEVIFDDVKKAAVTIIESEPNNEDPLIKDLKEKLEVIPDIWREVQEMSKESFK